MKTPQEIAAEALAYYRESILLATDPADVPSLEDCVAEAIAAAREEGRREGIEQAAKVACRLCGIGEPIIGTVNGRAMHNYYCGGHLSNGKSCRCGPKPCESDAIRALASQPKPEPGSAFFARVGKLEGSGPLIVSPPEPADRRQSVRIELTDEQRAALTVSDGAIPKPK